MSSVSHHSTISERFYRVGDAWEVLRELRADWDDEGCVVEIRDPKLLRVMEAYGHTRNGSELVGLLYGSYVDMLQAEFPEAVIILRDYRNERA